MQRIIMHIDVNNAFLSWSAIWLLKKGYPIDIRTIEAVIGGSESMRHGIVLAKSPIAKKRGVKTAETLREAKRKCHHLKVYPPNCFTSFRNIHQILRFYRLMSVL